MILQSLVAYYEALARNGVVQRPGWAYVRVSYKVILRADGTIRDIVSVKKAEKRGKKEVLVPWEIEAPERAETTSGIEASFLCDKAEYLLGYAKEDKNPIQKWEASRKLHKDVLPTPIPICPCSCGVFLKIMIRRCVEVCLCRRR